MAITPDEISTDDDLARRVLVRARSIAPCIDSFADGSESKKDAIAILKGVIAEIPSAGSRRVRSKSRNGTSISYIDIGGAFSSDDVSGLRSLCSAVPAGGPVGSFPAARAFEGIWPEEAYD